ncbi:MAG: CrcB family protein [Aeriscardovia sp.]|nr:CrcB family protein [Aeriscardovia sp.]
MGIVSPSSKHSKLFAILYVFLGGMIGTTLRAGLCQFQPKSWNWPWIVFCINVGGAFVLGIINASIGAENTKYAVSKNFVTFLGTGVMGAFTTYGTFIHETDVRFLANLGGIAVAYALVSVVLGVLAAGLGIWIGDIMLHGTIAEEEQIETEEVDG